MRLVFPKYRVSKIKVGEWDKAVNWLSTMSPPEKEHLEASFKKKNIK